MPLSYHIDADQGLITVSGADLVAGRELVTCAHSLLADPRFDSSLPHLIDLRGITMDDIAQAERNELAGIVRAQNDQRDAACVAVVVDENLKGEQTADLYHLICQLEQFELFDNFDLALRWLVKNSFQLDQHVDPRAEQG